MNKDKINLDKEIAIEGKSSVENLWVISLQKEKFSRKLYGPLKNDLGFVIVDEIIRYEGRFGNTSLSFEAKHSIFLPKFYFEKICLIRYQELVLHNGLKERNPRFPKQDILFDKLFEHAQRVKYMKDVLATILLTDLIYHIHEILPLQLLRSLRWIIQASYMFKTYTTVVKLTNYGCF